MARTSVRRTARSTRSSDLPQKSPLVTNRALLDLLVTLVTPQISPGAIVSDVLVHFGAGYGAEMHRDTSAGPATFRPIFKRPSDLNSFYLMLLESTSRNFPQLNWATNAPLRDQVRRAAFKHGELARQAVVADATGTLSIEQIVTTLRVVQQTCSASGAGGGLICDF